MEEEKPTKPESKRMTRFEEANFRAGLFGFPFCVVEYILNRRAIFLLGGGFFAAPFFASLIKRWQLGRTSIWKARPEDVEARRKR